MRLSKWRVPGNGWCYQEGEFRIRGDSADQLIANLAAHRKSNGKEIGDPWQDIQNQVLEEHPSLGII